VSVLSLLDPVALRSRVTGRSYWSVRYRDGSMLHEWERDWSLIPRRGLIAVRLYCPNGQIAELGNSVDAGDRLFQLKCGIRTAGSGKATLAHIIGMVVGTDGQCQCAAWEPSPGRLVTFDDNVWDFRYQGIGRLAMEHLGIKPD
jgi:hypothetical protein